MAIKAVDILKDFERSVRYFAPLHDCMEKDFEFALGKQWEDSDIATLKAAGVKALTINKIKPILKLLSGIERQSKSDYVAFPEGEEDGLVADIVSALLKNIVKQSKADRKLSEQFNRGNIGGMDFIEPYIDYTHDLINGKLQLRNINPMFVFPDPDAEEYDLSDGRFIVKFTPNLSKDQLKELYPTKEKAIDALDNGKVDIDALGETIRHTQGLDYPGLDQANNKYQDNTTEYGYDLIEYQYKNLIDKYYIVDKVAGIVQEADDKQLAEEYVANNPDSKLIKKKVPEIRVASYVGGEVLIDEVLWTYPQWKSFSIIPYFSQWLTIKIDDRELCIQGIVRGLKDLQEEYNKRRTQELRHLNSSVNSGIMYPKGSLTEQEKEKIKKHGSSPGITIEYDADRGKPERIPPAPLSQAHSQLAEENAQDLKEASGVNPDLLANSDNDQSGRAILLKQKQGLVMIQEALDNYSDTKKLLGKFLLSQLGKVYTIETAIKVLGNSFLMKYQEFKKPVIGEDQIPVVNPQTGQLETEIDMNVVNEVFNKVLNDSELGIYDISIGEGAYSETIRMSNYMTLVDMASKGLPIPPDVLISESLLPQGAKQKIIAALENAQMMAAKVQAQAPIKQNGDNAK